VLPPAAIVCFSFSLANSDYAFTTGRAIGHVYVDEALSGKNTSRPALTSLGLNRANNTCAACVNEKGPYVFDEPGKHWTDSIASYDPNQIGMFMRVFLS
jgi:hypothetical protein